MSMPLLTNLQHIETLLNAPNPTVSASIKRWHSAFMAIYCSRAIMSHSTLKKPNKTKAKASPSPTPTPTPSFTVVDLNPHHSFDIDQTALTDIVKEKELENLDRFGGVEEAEDEDIVVHKKKIFDKKGTNGKKNEVRGESNQEKEEQIMVENKELKDQ